MQFAYHRSLGPMIGVFLALATIEMLVVHLVVVLLLGWTVAVVVGVIDLSLVLYLIQLLRSFRQLPVTIVDGVLTMRTGSLKSVTIPVKRIAGLRPSWDAAAIKKRDVLNLALISWPSVVIDLKEPIVVGRRLIRAIAHKLDDPAAFHAAIASLSTPHDH